MYHKIIFLILILVQLFITATEIPVRSLKAPYVKKNITQDSLKCDPCNRPKRTEGPNISLEIIDDKTVLNCYGHGGAGFVTLFGCVKEAICLLESTEGVFEKSVNVIGAGCIGLTMAIELARKGYKVTIITENTLDLTSWRAGGLFDPGTGSEMSQQGLQRVSRAMATFFVYHQAELGQHPYLKTNIVRRLPLYCPASMTIGVEILAKEGYMPPCQPVSIFFDNTSVKYDGYMEHTTYFMDTGEIMKQLWQEVDRLQIPVIINKVQSFASCDGEIICNCAGINGGVLVGQNDVVPLRGHFFLLNGNAGSEHMNYMLFTKVPQDGKSEYIYLFPKNSFHSSEYPDGVTCQGMLGCSFVANTENMTIEDLEKLDKQELNKLEERAYQFFYGENNTAMV